MAPWWKASLPGNQMVVQYFVILHPSGSAHQWYSAVVIRDINLSPVGHEKLPYLHDLPCRSRNGTMFEGQWGLAGEAYFQEGIDGEHKGKKRNLLLIHCKSVPHPCRQDSTASPCNRPRPPTVKTKCNLAPGVLPAFRIRPFVHGIPTTVRTIHPLLPLDKKLLQGSLAQTASAPPSFANRIAACVLISNGSEYNSVTVVTIPDSWRM